MIRAAAIGEPMADNASDAIPVAMNALAARRRAVRAETNMVGPFLVVSAHEVNGSWFGERNEAPMSAS